MFWFSAWIVTWIISFLLYAKRYTSRQKFFGFSFVQFFYLTITLPITALCLINIGLEIVATKEVTKVGLPTDFLLSFYFLSVIVGVVGAAIHASSTSLSDLLKNHVFINAYSANEEIHGPVSHEIIFLSTLASILFLGLLGINHPIYLGLGSKLPIYAGIAIGIICALTVIRSTHIGLSLGGSFLVSAVLLLIKKFTMLDLASYPYFYLALSNALTIFYCLAFGLLVYLKSQKGTKIMIKVIFPRGHPFRETFSIV